eukprot:8821061-Prorocentrum_lima.AAC.1
MVILCCLWLIRQDISFPGGHGSVLDFTSKRFTTVARSSFVAELRNTLEASQAGVFYSAFMEESLDTNLAASVLSTRVDMGRMRMPSHVVGDNHGVFNCAINDDPNMNTETTLTLHVRALRELLEKGQCVRDLVV